MSWSPFRWFRPHDRDKDVLPASTPAHDIFVSYAREDRQAIEHLVRALERARGWSIWWDFDIRAGEAFDRRIQQALSTARCVLVVWTHESVQSDWVRAEAAEGWRREILVPVMLETCEPPLPFRQTQTADLSGWRDGDGQLDFDRLVSDIESVIERGPTEHEGRVLRRQTQERTLRRRLIRNVGIVLLIGVFATAGSFWRHQSQAREHREALAARLASKADELLSEVGDSSEHWGIFLREENRIDTLKLSLRLAAEAATRALTSETEATLRRVLGRATAPKLSIPVEEEFSDLAFSPDGRRVATTGDGLPTLLFDVDTGERLATLPHGGVVEFSSRGDFLATAGSDADVRVWEGTSGNELRRLSHDDTVTSIVFLPSSSRLVAGDAARGVRLWDVDSGQEIWRMQHTSAGQRYFGERPGIKSVTTSRSGALVAAVVSNVALVLDAASGRIIARLEGDNAVQEVIFSPDDKLALLSGATNIFDLTTGESRYVVRPPNSLGQVWGVYGPKVFSSDARQVIGLDQPGGGLGWWDVADGNWTRWSNDLDADSLIISPERDYVAVSRFDATARVFERGREIARFVKWHGGTMSALEFAPGGRILGTLMPSVSIDLWDVWPADPLAAACERMDRNLSPSEWQDNVGEEPYRETCAHLGGAFGDLDR